MRFGRLLIFSFALTGFAFSAQAQYTSRSTTTATGTTATKTQTTTSTAPTTNTNQYTKQTSSTNQYTKQASSTNQYTKSTTAPAAPSTQQQQQQPTQAVFRPRPQPQPVAMPQATGDDELPSFDALEKKVTAAQGSAQGSNLPPPPPPKGEIWFYIVNQDKMEIPVICTWKVVLQNKTDTEIKHLKIIYTLLGEKTPMIFSNIAPNASVVKRHGLYSEKCPALSQIKPKIDVVSCKMGTATGQDCLKYIIIK